MRDEILGFPNKDIDIEVYGLTREKLMEIAGTFGKAQDKGASFPVIGISGHDLDISMPRTESKTGDGHKGFSVSADPFLSYEKASSRRDFTINSLMKDVLTGEVIDCHGGLKDLDNKTIRMVNKNTFGDDPLRVLRAAQFAARFNFSIEPETMEVCRNMDVNVSRERIYGELEKALMKSNTPSIFFRSLDEMGKLSTMFPELDALKKCPENKTWHTEADSYEHTMGVIDTAARIKLLSARPEDFMLSALCHDLGKAVTGTVNKYGNMSYIGHEKETAQAEALLSRLTNDKETMKYVKNMISLHMQAHRTEEMREKSVMKMFDDSVAPDDLILLSFADKYAMSYEKSDAVKEETVLLKQKRAYDELKNVPEVTGNDLISLGLKPGPEFKEMLEFTHNLWLTGENKENAVKQLIGNYHINNIEKNKEESEYDAK